MQQQPNNMTQPNGMMMKPPVMVTVKDSLYLTDMLSWNLLAMKKHISLPKVPKIRLLNPILKNVDKCISNIMKEYLII